MGNLIYSFSYFAGQTADRMGIAKEETILRGCVELIFNVMFEQKNMVGFENPLDRNSRTSEKVIEWMTPRYNAFKKYAPDFFQNHPDADIDAVTVAMLCTGYTHFAHVPADNRGDSRRETIFKNDTIPWDVVERAEEIIDEAEKMAQRVYGSRDFPEDGNLDEPRIETIFLVHAFLSDTLLQIRAHEDFEYYTEENLESLKNEMLAPIRNFVLTYTAWGQDLIQQVAEYERYIDLMTGPAEEETKQQEPARAQPVLTLIRCQPSTP